MGKISFKHSCLFLVIILFLIVLFFQPGMVSDDAYITFRYIKNWVQGNGLVYNFGERVEGYSNFLWLVFLTPWAKLELDLPIVSEVFGLIFALAIIVLVYYFPRSYRKENDCFNLIAPALTSLNLSFLHYTFLGLESHLFTFLIWLSVFLYIVELKCKWIPFSGIVLFLVAATRPEGIIIFGALAIHRSIRSLANPNERKLSLIWFLFFIIPLILYTVWRYYYFGSIMPNIYYAKIGGSFWERIYKGFDYALAFLSTYWAILLCITILLNILFLSIRNKVNKGFVPIYMVIGIYILFIIYAGGDWMDYHRFFIPIIPGFALFMQESWIKLGTLFSRNLASVNNLKKKRIKLFFTMSIIGLLLVLQVDLLKVIVTRAYQENSLAAYVQNRISARLHPTLNSIYVEIADWMNQHTENKQAAIAIPDIGIIGYYTNFRIVDLYGLVTPAVAHSPGPMHGKLNYNYVLEQNPEFILISYLRGSNLLRGSPMKDNELMHMQYDFARVFVRLPRREKLEMLYQRNTTQSPFRYAYDFIEHYPDAACFLYKSGGKQLVPSSWRYQELPRWRLMDPVRGKKIIQQCERGLNNELQPEEIRKLDTAAKSVLVSLSNVTTEYAYQVKIPSHAFLQFAIGVKRTGETSDSRVSFEVFIEHQNKNENLFTGYIDPGDDSNVQQWHNMSIPLEKYTNQKVLLRFVTSPGIGGWGNPWIVVLKE